MNRILLSCLMICLAQLAHAQFSGNFASGQFTHIDTNSNGTVVFVGTDSLHINGTDGMGGGYGVDLARVNITTTGTISFSYDVTAIDNDGPAGMYDEFGYQLNGVYTPVAYDTGLGLLSVPVSAGDTFAFYVSSDDNTMGGLNVSVFGHSFSPSTPLPLDLVSFTGVNAGTFNKLRWTTANERQVSSFIIERSTDAAAFVAIGNIAATNMADGAYSFVDAAANGRSFYRLKMLDMDNSYRYSPVVRVDGPMGGAIKITCSPLPFTDELNVSLSNAEEDLRITISDIGGKIQVCQAQVATTSMQTVKLSGLGQLPAGIYLLHISNNQGVLAQQKIIKR